MGNRRTLLAAAAIILALAAGMGVYFYTSGADKRAEGKVETVEAYVAVTDIPKGTAGATALSQGLIAPAKVLKGSVPPAAVTDASVLDGKIAGSLISAKQYITDASFLSPAEGGGGSLAAAIGDKNLVAVTISFDAPRSVANQVMPGDRVDLIDGQGYLLRSVKILAVGTETASTAAGGNGQASSTATGSGLYTFEVTSEQALQIVTANRGGSLTMALLPLSATNPSGNSSVPASGR